MKLFKIITFSTISFVLFLLIIELTPRAFFSLKNKTILPLLYGYDRNVKILVISMKNLNFSFFKYEKNVKPLSPSLPNINNGKLVYCSGGSTTAGKSCSKLSSSWPDELASISPSLHINNLAVSGTNSDYALMTIRNEISNGRIPDYVFYANWMNEIDVLDRGFNLNKDYFLSVYPESYEKVQQHKINGAIFFLFRLDKTLADISLFYFFSKSFFDRLKDNIPIINSDKSTGYKKRAESDIAISLKNYELNLNNVYKLLNDNNCTLIIIRPPICWPYIKNVEDLEFYEWLRKWDKQMIDFVKNYSKNMGVRFIDTQKAYDNYDDFSKYFCDVVHQNLEGHKIMADFIKNNLKIQR